MASFFFQAEDGIRDGTVTGVQTCALPIFILGRGSSIDSFPLFGYDLADYETLFEEKVNLFAELMKGGPVTWQGSTRAALLKQDVVPHVEAGPFPVWIGVGGSPQSVVRAAHYGFNL